MDFIAAFSFSFQDNQELRTTKYPTSRLCEEPSSALHVSAASCCLCPSAPPARLWSQSVAPGRGDAEGERVERWPSRYANPEAHDCQIS